MMTPRRSTKRQNAVSLVPRESFISFSESMRHSASAGCYDAGADAEMLDFVLHLTISVFFF